MSEAWRACFQEVRCLRNRRLRPIEVPRILEEIDDIYVHGIECTPEVTTDGVKVGCTFVDAENVRAIYRRLVALGAFE